MMNDGFPHISLDALARNDEAAWNTAYPILYREIWIVLKARLRPGFGIDPEDLAVEIITEVIMPGLRDRHSDSFERVQTFEGLLKMAKSIAARRAVDAIRGIMRKKEDALPEGWEQLIGAEEAVIDSNHEGFWQRVSRLKPPKPELFADYFIGGMSYLEIAKLREMALGTVCSHFKRGLDQLRREMEAGEDADTPEKTDVGRKSAIRDDKDSGGTEERNVEPKVRPSAEEVES